MTPTRKRQTKMRPLTKKEYESVRGGLADRLGVLIGAYRRGMIIARTKDEEELLAEIRRLLGPPHPE